MINDQTINLIWTYDVSKFLKNLSLVQWAIGNSNNSIEFFPEGPEGIFFGQKWKISKKPKSHFYGLSTGILLKIKKPNGPTALDIYS